MTHIKIMKRLIENGFKAYIVGGFVRDSLLGIPNNDIDLTTNAIPEQVMALFPKTVPTGIKHGTVVVIENGEEFEITTFRQDGEYTDGRRPDTVLFSTSITDDLSRRDLTINAMAMDINGNIIDPFNGREDLKNGIIRAVGEPKKRFTEDALRILRAFRFSARFGFGIEPNTLKAITATKEGLRKISKERISSEITKILLTDNVENTFHLMEETGVLEIILPDISKMVGVTQNHPFHIWDLFTHTLKSVENIDKDIILRWAMLLHDVGKVDTKFIDENDIDRFHGHAKKSAEIADKVLTELKFDNSTKNVIIELVEQHDNLILPESKYVRRAIARLNIDLDLLLQVQTADTLAQNPAATKDKLDSINRIKKIMKEEGEKITLKDLAVNGNDLMNLGLKGKQIGDTLNHLLEMILDDPSNNNKEYLLREITTIK